HRFDPRKDTISPPNRNVPWAKVQGVCQPVRRFSYQGFFSINSLRDIHLAEPERGYSVVPFIRSVSGDSARSPRFSQLETNLISRVAVTAAWYFGTLKSLICLTQNEITRYFPFIPHRFALCEIAGPAVLVEAMHSGHITVKDNLPSRSDDAFQELLLRFSTAAAEGKDSRSLIRLFCQATREFFRASGAYFWEISAPDEMVGAEADGLLADRFRDTRVRLSTARSSVAVDSIRQRRTLFLNQLDPHQYPMAAQYQTKSIMSAPLIVAGEVIGVAAYIHDSDPEFFHDDLGGKGTILGGQMGSLLEAMRLTHASREEQRRVELLADVATALHPVPAASSIMEALADSARGLLRSSAVAILLRQEKVFAVRAIACDPDKSSRVVFEGKALDFAQEIATRVVSAGEPLLQYFDGTALNAIGLPSGQLLAFPFRTSKTQGAMLVYPRKESAFSSEERSLLANVVGFGALAIAN